MDAPTGPEDIPQHAGEGTGHPRARGQSGLYNGFLAAGLFWGALQARTDVLGFFLGCVVVAGCYGAYSVNRRIFFVQALPALIALALLWLPG